MSQDQTAPAISKIIAKGAEYLAHRGIDSARLDAELLLAHVLGLERIQLYMRFDQPLELAELDKYREVLVKRGRRTPLAYVTGIKEFYSLGLCVDSSVLIPRPETELLVDWLLTQLGKAKQLQPMTIVELGTGTGAIAIALAHNMLKRSHGSFQIYATDISLAALEVARTNVERWQVEEVVQLLHGDLYGALPESLKSQVEIIVSNPPYIPTDEVGRLAPEIQEYEPLGALDGGPEGLDFYSRILEEGRRFLAAGGLMVLEVGDGQGQQVMAMAHDLGYKEIELHGDYGGRERMVTAQWR